MGFFSSAAARAPFSLFLFERGSLGRLAELSFLILEPSSFAGRRLEERGSGSQMALQKA